MFYVNRLKVLKKIGIKLLIFLSLSTLLLLTYLYLKPYMEYIAPLIAMFFLFAFFIRPSFKFCLKAFFTFDPILEVSEDGILLFGFQEIPWDRIKNVQLTKDIPDDVLEIEIFLPSKHTLMQSAHEALNKETSIGGRFKTIKIDNVLTCSSEYILNSILAHWKKAMGISEVEPAKEELDYSAIQALQDEIKDKEVVVFVNKKELRSTIITFSFFACFCFIAAWLTYNTGLVLVTAGLYRHGMPLWMVAAICGIFILCISLKHVVAYLKQDPTKPMAIINKDGIKMLPSKHISWQEVDSVTKNDQSHLVRVNLKGKSTSSNYITFDHINLSSQELADVLQKYHKAYGFTAHKDTPSKEEQ